MADRVRGFEEREYRMVQSGIWGERTTYMVFEGTGGVKLS